MLTGTDAKLSAGELAYCDAIRKKDIALRAYLAATKIPETNECLEILRFLVGVKKILGNFSNDLSFVSTLLIKGFLADRFGIDDFDAGAKPQGAKGIDVIAYTKEGSKIIGELKTTTPYQKGFGANQRKTILKDLDRLKATSATHRFMFVTDESAFQTLCSPSFAEHAAGIEIVNLVSKSSFSHPTTKA